MIANATPEVKGEDRSSTQVDVHCPRVPRL